MQWLTSELEWHRKKRKNQLLPPAEDASKVNAILDGTYQALYNALNAFVEMERFTEAEKLLSLIISFLKMEDFNKWRMKQKAPVFTEAQLPTENSQSTCDDQSHCDDDSTNDG